MPRMIVKSGRANALSYTLAPSQSFEIESVSADIDTHGGSTVSVVDVIYRDAAGFLIAQSRSSQSFDIDLLYEVTFAPDLPDTLELGNAFSTQVNTSGLAATTLPPQATVTVQVSDPAARVTQVRLWVEDAVDAGSAFDDEDAAAGHFMLVPGPGA